MVAKYIIGENLEKCNI